MKLTGLVLATAVAGVSAFGGLPAPTPAPAPGLMPAPSADHHAPAPKDGGDSSGFYGSTTSYVPDQAPPTSTQNPDQPAGTTTAAPKVGINSVSSECASAFTDNCGDAVDCGKCVFEHAMILVNNDCDTIELVQKVCPTLKRALRGRNLLLDLTKLPAPYPAPAPEDPPAPEFERVAPAPLYDYVRPEDMFYASSTVPQAVVTDKPPTDDTCTKAFTTTCGKTFGKTCANCVNANKDLLLAANCDIMQVISKSCPTTAVV